MSQPLLEGRQEYMEDRGPDVIERLEARIDELEAAIPAIKRDAVVTVLSLLTESLRHVASGKMDIPDVSHATGSGSDGRWEAIKSRLAPRLRDAVEVLLLHGGMTVSQIAAAMKMNRTNCSNNVVLKLKTMGLVTKNGEGLYVLKQL